MRKLPSPETVQKENVLAQSSPSLSVTFDWRRDTSTPIVVIVKDADAGRPGNEIWRTYGISSATYDTWNAT